MKSFFRMLLAESLVVFARAIVRRYKPTIVMVTGSVGKTSAKDAIAAVLADTAYVRASEKSYRSHFGVPLTIIGAENPRANPVGWLRVMREVLALLILPNHYPQILVIEIAAERPGDVARALRIATPDAVVVTCLPEIPVHVEAYASPETVRNEEFAPAYALPTGAPLILNAEDEYALAYAKHISASVTTFGFGDAADIRVTNPHVYSAEGKALGMQAEIEYDDESSLLKLPHVLGRQQLLAPAAAIALATALGTPFNAAFKALKEYEPPYGRARLLAGRKGSVLIDDSYNASPSATEGILLALKTMPAKRRIAVLGDMLELGRYSVAEHERIGALAADCADIIVTVGIRARKIAEAAYKQGTAEHHTYSFDTTVRAAEALREMVQEGDAVLIKGSQSIRTERITAALLSDPADRKKLVRQERAWRQE